MNQPQFTFEELEELHRLLLKSALTHVLESAQDKIEVAMMAV